MWNFVIFPLTTIVYYGNICLLYSQRTEFNIKLIYIYSYKEIRLYNRHYQNINSIELLIFF